MTEEAKQEIIAEDIKQEESKPAGIANFSERVVACYLDLILFYGLYLASELIIIRPIFGYTLLSSCINLFSFSFALSNIILAQFFIISSLYILMLAASVVFETSKDQTKFGKKLIGIYVLDEHLKPINYFKSAIRNSAKLLSASVLGLGFFYYYFNNKKQTLHDVISGTVVVKKAEVEPGRLVFISCWCSLIAFSYSAIVFFMLPEQKKQVEQPKRELQLPAKLQVKKELARLSFNSEKSETSVALWHHEQGRNTIEIGFFTEKLAQEELIAIRNAKTFVNAMPVVVVAFDLQLATDNLNVATVTKYGVSFNRTKEVYFPGVEGRVDFFYVPSVTENLELAKLSGKLAEGERVTGYLNNQDKKTVGQVDFDADWDISFNLPLIDLEKPYIESGNNLSAENVQIEAKETYCKLKADQTELLGVDSLALFYPEEGDIALGVFADELSDLEKEEFRKKKSIWSNVNGKHANFVIFFDFKREFAGSYSKDSLLEYSVYFIRDNYGRLYFPGATDRVQFNFKEMDFAADDIRTLSGNTQQISFYLSKKKESKLSGLQFSWDCKMNSKILNVQ